MTRSSICRSLSRQTVAGFLLPLSLLVPACVFRSEGTPSETEPVHGSAQQTDHGTVVASESRLLELARARASL